MQNSFVRHVLPWQVPPGLWNGREKKGIDYDPSYSTDSYAY